MKEDVEKYKIEIQKINQRIKEFLWKARNRVKAK